MRTKILTIVATTIIISPLASYAEANPTHWLETTHAPVGYKDVTTGTASTFTTMGGQTVPIAVGDYFLIKDKSNTPELVVMQHVADSVGKEQKLVVSQDKIAVVDRLFKAFSPNYVHGSALKSVRAVVGTPKDYKTYNVVVADPAVAGLGLTEANYVGRTIINNSDRLETIKRLSDLPENLKSHVIVKHGMYNYTLKELASRGGLQVGDTIEFSKDIVK